MMKQRTLLILSGALAFAALVMGYFEPYRLCSENWRSCMHINYAVDIILLPVIPLFTFSLITYFLREEIYRTWFKFARVWIPLSMIAIFLAPEYSHDWMFPIEKGTVAFFSSALFVIISIGIIISKVARKKAS